MNPGRTIAARQSVPAMVFEDQGLGLGLGAGIGIERIGGGGHGLVGSVMVAAFVDAERADVDEPFELGAERRHRAASEVPRR